MSVHNRKGIFYSVPFKKSLRFRLTSIYVIGTILLGAIVLSVVNYALDRRMETEYIAKGNAVANTVAYMVKGEMVDRYLSTLETDAEYETMLSYLRTIQIEHGLLYVCVIRMVKNGEVLVFDTDDVEEGTSALGMFISWVDSFGEGHDDYINALLRGESVGPLVSNGVYGYILSTYVPIYRDDKSVAAYACVDISMDKLKQEETVIFLLTSIGVILALILTITTSLFIFRRYILSPIKILLHQAASVNVVGSNSANETPLQARLKFGDEMAVLERAIIEMELRIRTEVAEAEYYAKAANTLSNTAFLLLSQKEETFEYTMMNGIGLIADMMDLDRVTVWRNTMKPDGLYGGQVFRWDRNDGGATPAAMQFAEIKVSEWAPRWEKVLSAGETINGPVRLLPEAELLQSFGCVSVFITPIIITKENFLGYVMFEDRNRERKFTDSEADILQTVSLMISSLRKIKELTENIMNLKIEAEKIYLDPLTDIYNRRYLEENMKRVISSLSRSGAAFSLMMIDIDYFKKYNDVYGHTKGDDCLKAVAAALKNSLTRIDDFIVRYGGEEFTVALPNTVASGARLIADRMLNNIRNLKIPHKASDVADHVTISIGVVSGIAKHTYNADYWLGQADKMLYKSKQEGRNRYTFETVDGNS